MKRHLVDAGPLVALLSGRDRYHLWARRVLDSIEPPLYTCEAVVAETCHLVRGINGGPEAVLELISLGVVEVDFSIQTQVTQLHALMHKFADVPMSLADACLVQMTQLHRDSVVVTLDSDFRVYRRNRIQPVPTLMPDDIAG